MMHPSSLTNVRLEASKGEPSKMKASRLIELLARYIGELGDVEVLVDGRGINEYQPITCCWDNPVTSYGEAWIGIGVKQE